MKKALCALLSAMFLFLAGCGGGSAAPDTQAPADSGGGESA